MNVLPDPVAIWISARGRFAASDRSRFAIARNCAGHSPVSCSSGSARSRWRSVGASGWRRISSSQPASVSGRWNENTGRLAGSGSSRFVNRVSVPVDSYDEREPALDRRLELVWQPVDVLRALMLDPGERLALLLRLHHARRAAVEEQQVVGAAVRSLHHELPHRHTPRGGEVHGPRVLHRPAGGLQHLVDPHPSATLRQHVRAAACDRRHAHIFPGLAGRREDRHLARQTVPITTRVAYPTSETSHNSFLIFEHRIATLRLRRLAR